MNFDKINEKLSYNGSLVEKLGFNPYYNEIQTSLDDRIVINGNEYINLASNNYLGLANDDRIKAAIVQAVNKYGASLCGTPVATGYIDLLRRVEGKIACFLGLNSAILLPSCYQANNGLFMALADKDDLIIIDRGAHSSLVQGAKAAGCRIRPFLHNNMEHLQGILDKSTAYRQVFVVTESVFSTDGSIAPFQDIINLCNQYGAMPIIDDSHGIGVIGKSGKGILEEAGIKEYKGLYTASLGKAFANFGGVIAGEKRIIEYLRYYCPHLIYSTALPPSILGGIEKTIEIIETEFQQISKIMWSYKKQIYDGLVNAGFEVASGKAPINSIMAQSAENTILLAKRLYEYKILSTPFIEPSVPANEGRVRLIAGANLKEATIESVIDVIKRIGK